MPHRSGYVPRRKCREGVRSGSIDAGKISRLCRRTTDTWLGSPQNEKIGKRVGAIMLESQRNFMHRRNACCSGGIREPGPDRSRRDAHLGNRSRIARNILECAATGERDPVDFGLPRCSISGRGA